MTSLLAVEHGRLHHDGQAQLPLVDLLLALLAPGTVRLGILSPEGQVVGGHLFDGLKFFIDRPLSCVFSLTRRNKHLSELFIHFLQAGDFWPLNQTSRTHYNFYAKLLI